MERSEEKLDGNDTTLLRVDFCKCLKQPASKQQFYSYSPPITQTIYSVKQDMLSTVGEV